MKKQLIGFLFVIALLFCGCSQKEICYSGTADELMSVYIKNNAVNFKKGDLVEVEGTIAYISYPKDGFRLNECAAYVGTEGCNPKRREGNYISCVFNYRLDDNFVGKKVRVKGFYEKINYVQSGIYIKLRKCEIEETEQD